MKTYVSIFLLCFPTLSFAKCAAKIYTLDGIVSSADGTPRAKAYVGVQWQDHFGTKQKIVATNTSGSFLINIPFNTYSRSNNKSGPEDICENTLEKITLKATDPTLGEKVHVVSVEQTKTTVNINF